MHLLIRLNHLTEREKPKLLLQDSVATSTVNKQKSLFLFCIELFKLLIELHEPEGFGYRLDKILNSLSNKTIWLWLELNENK